MKRKKEIERIYLEEARRASTIFPSSEPVDHERPDFLLPLPSGTLGIEVTELCREEERHEGARLGHVAPKAKRLYMRRGAHAVSVSPVFSHHADDMSVDELAASLADFVFDHRDTDASYSWNDDAGMPKGYCHIGVFHPSEWEADGVWRYFKGFDGGSVEKDMLDSRIFDKNRRLTDYRKAASVVWLLIVNDLFLGPGEVHLRDDQLARWVFDFAFDKVVVFERQPGGSGRVIELPRRT